MYAVPVADHIGTPIPEGVTLLESGSSLAMASELVTRLCNRYYDEDDLFDDDNAW